MSVHLELSSGTLRQSRGRRHLASGSGRVRRLQPGCRVVVQRPRSEGGRRRQARRAESSRGVVAGRGRRALAAAPGEDRAFAVAAWSSRGRGAAVWETSQRDCPEVAAAADQRRAASWRARGLLWAGGEDGRGPETKAAEEQESRRSEAGDSRGKGGPRRPAAAQALHECPSVQSYPQPAATLLLQWRMGPARERRQPRPVTPPRRSRSGVAMATPSWRESRLLRRPARVERLPCVAIISIGKSFQSNQLPSLQQDECFGQER
ncbi:hypothetical protein H8959_016084 [Pygathrix nigripes]